MQNWDGIKGRGFERSYFCLSSAIFPNPMVLLYFLSPEYLHPHDPCGFVCFFLTTEDKVWTIVSHDLQMQTTVVGYNPEKYSVTQLVYSASMDQISAITSSAEYCEQYVSYFCKMSRLLNTPGRLRGGRLLLITNSADEWIDINNEASVTYYQLIQFSKLK